MCSTLHRRVRRDDSDRCRPSCSCIPCRELSLKQTNGVSRWQRRTMTNHSALKQARERERDIEWRKDRFYSRQWCLRQVTENGNRQRWHSLKSSSGCQRSSVPELRISSNCIWNMYVSDHDQEKLELTNILAVLGKVWRNHAGQIHCSRNPLSISSLEYVDRHCLHRVSPRTISSPRRLSEERWDHFFSTELFDLFFQLIGQGIGRRLARVQFVLTLG